MKRGKEMEGEKQINRYLERGKGVIKSRRHTYRYRTAAKNYKYKEKTNIMNFSDLSVRNQARNHSGHK